MSEAMATRPASMLRRDTRNRWVAGVCSGLARHYGVDPLIVRVVFIAGAMAGGIGLAVYALAWVFVPAGEAPSRAPVRRTGRGSIEIALGVALLALAVLLTFRALGLLLSDVIVWPLTLVAAGMALLWRQTLGGGPGDTTADADAAPPAPAHPLSPQRTATTAPKAPSATDRAALVSRTGLGIALVIGAGLAFLSATGALSAARDVVLSVLVVAIVLGVIFMPVVMRLVRSLTAERSERIRSQERAEMAAHLHDSVLQTLALVQQRADDPRAVTALARRQERELRSWLTQREDTGPLRLGRALEVAASEIERDHGVVVDVVAVGDADLDGRGEALVAAAREAMVNAAKFGAGSPVDVYAEAVDGELQVFVRDRGPGFDASALPPDRRGVRESIVGRMARHGGHAAIHSAPGAGTEVELTMPGSGA
jgi:signal transduction histidine kinase/phage shock protein PspC (stress-responsive transcriptional regulator)